MASSFKTDFLGLNKFVGTDKPKMADFNADNSTLDSKIKAHHQNTSIHLSTDVVGEIVSSARVVGSYVGNGVFQRSISLGFVPKFGIIFAVGEVPSFVDMVNFTNHIYSAMISNLGCSKGVVMTGDGFKVTQTQESSMDGKNLLLNKSGTTYVYFVVK